MKQFFFLLLLTCFQLFSQKLEEKIYKSVDELVAHPTQENIEKLTVFEKSIDPKTDAELLAFVILNCNKAYFQNQLLGDHAGRPYITFRFSLHRTASCNHKIFRRSR